MFSVVKVREGLSAGDYKDPGWFKNPEGTVAYEYKGEKLAEAPRTSGPDSKRDSLDWSVKDPRKPRLGANGKPLPVKAGAIPITDDLPEEDNQMRSRMIGLSLVLALALPTTAAIAGPGAAGHGHGDETAYGKPGDPKKPARLVQVVMSERDGKMSFIPDRIEVRRGEQIKLALRNNGELDHELVLATLEENLKHAIEMQKNPDMEHDDPNAKRLMPKKTARSSGSSPRPASSTSPASSRASRSRHDRQDHRQVTMSDRFSRKDIDMRIPLIALSLASLLALPCRPPHRKRRSLPARSRRSTRPRVS